MKLVTLAEAATLTGYTIGTLHNYASAGLFPPPRRKIGNVGLFTREDVRAFMKSHNARPNARKSVRQRGV